MNQMKNKVLSVIVSVGILFVLFTLNRGKVTWLEQKHLLDISDPGYTSFLMNLAIDFYELDIDSYIVDYGYSTENIEGYLLIHADKDGFGNAKPDDLRLYLNYLRHTYPQASWLSLLFNDGTGVVIPLTVVAENLYGRMNSDGVLVEYVDSVDLSVPLIEQLDGITFMRKDIDAQGKLIFLEYYDVDKQPVVRAGGYTAILQTWDGDRLVSRIYLDSSGLEANRSEGYSRVVWNEDVNGVWRIHFYNQQGTELDQNGINLTDCNVSLDGWTAWMTPAPDKRNKCFTIGRFNLGECEAGTVYTCQMEIEFKDVTALVGREFRFWSQGAQDNEWITDNIWNSELIWLDKPPEDGCYFCSTSMSVTEDMTEISYFDIGFRCDYWESGSFRVRNIVITKGDNSVTVSPGI